MFSAFQRWFQIENRTLFGEVKAIYVIFFSNLFVIKYENVGSRVEGLGQVFECWLNLPYLCQNFQSETTVGKLRTSPISPQRHGCALITASPLNGDNTVCQSFVVSDRKLVQSRKEFSQIGGIGNCFILFSRQISCPDKMHTLNPEIWLSFAKFAVGPFKSWSCLTPWPHTGKLDVNVDA